MTTRLLASVTLILVLGAVPAAAQFSAEPNIVPPEDFHLELGLMFWHPTPELSLTTGEALVGTVDFVQDFGIGEENFREFRAVLKPGRKHKIRFAYVPFSYDQDTVLQRTIAIQNISFPATATANADLAWRLYTFAYEWDFVSRSHGFVGLVAGAKYNKVEADVTATVSAFGLTQTFGTEFNQDALVPTIGAIGRGYLGDYVSITGEFGVFKIDGEEWRGKFYDVDIYGAAHLGKYVGAQLGWRSVIVDFLVDEDAGDMNMKGLYFGGFVRF